MKQKNSEPNATPATKNHYDQQATMLANRVSKRYRHLKKRFSRQNIDIFRLYDWDIPEIRAVVDWYGGHLVIGEYTRRQSTDDWLPLMGLAVARALGVSQDRVHLKQRNAGINDGARYERIAYTDRTIVLSERDLKFHINLDDYVDTGLFSDHRDTRQMIREMAGGCHFLNLFCYTGSFTCYAAAGGALSTTSVDRSRTAISWTRSNMKLNKIPEKGHTFLQLDTFDFLKKAQGRDLRYDLAVVDPPSYSTTRENGRHVDLRKEYPALLKGVAGVMKPGARVIFSTNHQNFPETLAADGLSHINEITDRTLPEDFQNKRKQIHRCWEIIV